MPIPREQAAMVASIRQKLAMLEPEERFAMGFGSAADSTKVMGSTGLAEARKIQAMKRLGATPAQIDSTRAGLERPTDRKLTARELAGNRLVEGGNATRAEVDSTLAGVERVKVDKPPEKTEKQKALDRMVGRGELSESQADSVTTGLKRPPSTVAERPDFAQAKSVYQAQYRTSPITGQPLDKGAPRFLDWYWGDWQNVKTGKKLDREDKKMIGDGSGSLIRTKKGNDTKDTQSKKTGTWKDYR